MNRRYLLDTNILSAAFKRDRSVLQRISEAEYYLSSVVLGELYEWALWPSSHAQRLDWLRHLTSGPVVKVDTVTSERFGRLSGLLKQRGIGCGDNDLWIASQALQHNLVVVTRDSDFDGIPDLMLERW